MSSPWMKLHVSPLPRLNLTQPGICCRGQILCWFQMHFFQALKFFTHTLLSLVHAAVIAINEAIDRGQASVTIGALNNPNAMLRNTQEALAQDYQDTLSQAKAHKQDQSSGRVRSLLNSSVTFYTSTPSFICTKMFDISCKSLISVRFTSSLSCLSSCLLLHLWTRLMFLY